jgi:PAS domain S-box-containing protein
MLSQKLLKFDSRPSKAETAKPVANAFEVPFLVSYAAFELLFENNPQPMWIYDHKNHRFLAVNNAAVRNYLYSRNEFLSMTTEQIHSPEDAARLYQLDAETSVESTSSSIWRHRRKDGTFFDAEVVTHAMMYKEHQAHLVLALDVTARARVEEALHESENRYRDLFEHANDIVFTTDLSGNFTSFNKMGELVMGMTADEALTKNILDIIAPEDVELARNMREQKLVDGGHTTYELQIVRKDGQRVILAIQSSLTYRDGKPTGVRGIARDITERKQFDDRVRQSQKMEALGRLAGGIAHDFNNLLGVIVGFSELMVNEIKPGSALHSFALETLKAGNQAASLTQQLLAFSRSQVLQPKILQLNASLANMEVLLSRLLPENIKLICKPGEALGRIKADPSQLEQVLLNLAVNARDAMPNGGELTIETQSVVIDKFHAEGTQGQRISPGAYVQLSVGDTGTGIDERTKARLFEPFFTTKLIGKGTGLGLATVYGIVKQSGGYVTVQSRLGRGTTFNVYFPHAQEVETRTEADRRSTAVLTGAETILLVEDAESLRRFVRIILERNGYTVLEAKSSPDAARIAEMHRGEIDLLLTDIVMPQLDGCQLSDHLRFLRSEMKVLFMSGYAGPAVLRPATDPNRPEVPVLPKPFAAESLLRMVRQTLDEPHADLHVAQVPEGEVPPVVDKPLLVAAQSCGR